MIIFKRIEMHKKNSTFLEEIQCITNNRIMRKYICNFFQYFIIKDFSIKVIFQRKIDSIKILNVITTFYITKTDLQNKLGNLKSRRIKLAIFNIHKNQTKFLTKEHFYPRHDRFSRQTRPKFKRFSM